MLDLLVIGAGLAGLTAALEAADHGLTVRVIAKGLGAHHWSPGTIDLLGYHIPDESTPAGAKDRDIDPSVIDPSVIAPYVVDPYAAITQLPSTHPYRMIGQETVAQGIDSFRRLMAQSNLDYDGNNGNQNMPLPSPVGAVRPTLLAPRAQHGGNLEENTPMLIVGFTGLRDFYPSLIVENLEKQGHSARSLTLPIEMLTDRRDSNTVQLAQAFDNPQVQTRIVAALHREVQPGERIGFPAILGLTEYQSVLEKIESALSATIFEIPTLPPSVPGVRLHRWLREECSRRGVRVEAGMEAIDFKADQSGIRSVSTETSARPLQHRAERYLLATGGVLGGGFTCDHTGRFWETIFDLPLTVPQRRDAWFHPHFLNPNGQPVFHGGVRVNGDFQPVDGDDAIVFPNLFAAGNLLNGADGIQERSLEGIAITSGFAAARALVAKQ